MQREENGATTESKKTLWVMQDSRGGAVSNVDTLFVNMYRTAGEILWWLHAKTLCSVELSVVSQSFVFRFSKQLDDGREITWRHSLAYSEIDQSRTPCTAEQWADHIAAKWNEVQQ